MSSPRSNQSTQELRQLVAMLERSGIAEQRPEARALLLRSRALLRERQSGARRIAGKFGMLVILTLDTAMLGSAMILGGRHLAGSPGPAEIALAAVPPAWLLFRLRHHAHWLSEAGRWTCYHLAWLYDWFAETVSTTALARLDARIAAREVMSGWRQHRRALPHRARLEDVRAFLAAEYGVAAERAFHREAEAIGEARDWTMRGGITQGRAAQRLAELRWSALIKLFERIAASGALWPEALPAIAQHGKADWPSTAANPSPPLPPAVAAAPADPTDTPERAARRADLRDAIRRKRQDITTAFGWRLKTEAEITQRDTFLAQLRAEIAEMERELAQLGG